MDGFPKSFYGKLQKGKVSNRFVTWLDRTASILGRSIPFSKAITFIGVSVLFLTACLIFVDVVLRYVFNSPITGVSETSGLALVVVTFFSLAYTQSLKGHVSIDLLTERLSPKSQVVINNIIYFLCVGTFLLAVWQSLTFTLYTKEANMTIPLLDVPVFPFAAVVPFGFILLTVVLLRDLFNNVAEGVRLGLGGRLWLLSFGILLLVVAGMIFWMQSTLWEANLPMLGIIGLLVTFIFILTGIPVSFALILLSFVLYTNIRGLDAAFIVVGNLPFRILDTYTWAVIGIFVLMGYIIFASGLGKDLYYSAYKWLGHLPGGLAAATIGGGTALAAAVGDVMSSTVTFGTIALPEMRRYNYSDRLSTGAICAAATLGPLIPPGVTFIIYGLITKQSIATLFIGGILPGLLLSAVFIGYIYIACRRNPTLGPRGPSTKFSEKLVSLKRVWPVPALFILVIGGMYAGIFTPNEGASIGFVGALIIGLSMKRFNRQNFVPALFQAGSLIAMIFLIVVGALMLGYFIAASKLHIVAGEFLTGAAVPPVVTIIAISLIFMILGCFMDAVAIIVITVPIFYPIILSLGYDPIWFGIMVVVLTNLGMITPPFGVIPFALRGITKDISLATIFRGTFPFIIANVVVVGLIIAFPQIATFLPDLLGR